MWFFNRVFTPPKNKNPEKELYRKVREIQIHSRKMVNDVMAGEYQSAFKGRGMEFDTVREYQEGDELRMIDWNVTARYGHPYVKTFVEERELTVIFLVDISASGVFGTQIQQKREVIAELCGVLALNAMKKNDRIGLILFSDQIELYVPPKKGKTHVSRIIRELLFFKARHKKTDLNQALEYFNKLNKRKTVVFLVSDYLDDGYFKNMSATNQRHDLVAIEVQDPHEEKLPDIGIISLMDTETGETQMVDTHSQSWQRHYYLSRLQFNETKTNYFKKNSIDHLIIKCDQPYGRQLTTFFKNRARRNR